MMEMPGSYIVYDPPETLKKEHDLNGRNKLDDVLVISNNFQD